MATQLQYQLAKNAVLLHTLAQWQRMLFYIPWPNGTKCCAILTQWQRMVCYIPWPNGKGYYAIMANNAPIPRPPMVNVTDISPFPLSTLGLPPRGWVLTLFVVVGMCANRKGQCQFKVYLKVGGIPYAVLFNS